MAQVIQGDIWVATAVICLYKSTFCVVVFIPADIDIKRDASKTTDINTSSQDSKIFRQKTSVSKGMPVDLLSLFWRLILSSLSFKIIRIFVYIMWCLLNQKLQRLKLVPPPPQVKSPKKKGSSTSEQDAPATTVGTFDWDVPQTQKK